MRKSDAVWKRSAIRELSPRLEPECHGACRAQDPTKPNGMGMGLSICRCIIEAHGGHLSVQPDHEVGTTLAFRIPIGRAAISPG
jgi:hypothetical protein